MRERLFVLKTEKGFNPHKFLRIINELRIKGILNDIRNIKSFDCRKDKEGNDGISG